MRTFDATTNKVVSGLNVFNVVAKCVPSIFETKWTDGPPSEYGFKASVTI